MMRLLDYYYLALFRGYENIQGKDRFFPFHVVSIMSLTLTFNIFSLAILLLDHNIIRIFFICYFIVGVLIIIIFDVIYNKKRRERLIEKYKDESLESRRRGAAWVWFYEILSIAFFIWACSMIAGPQP